MAINETSLIVVEGNWLRDATTVESLVISLNSAKVSQMHKMLGPKVRVIATKAVAFKAVVMARIIGRTLVRPIL